MNSRAFNDLGLCIYTAARENKLSDNRAGIHTIAWNVESCITINDELRQRTIPIFSAADPAFGYMWGHTFLLFRGIFKYTPLPKVLLQLDLQAALCFSHPYI